VIAWRAPAIVLVLLAGMAAARDGIAQERDGVAHERDLVGVEILQYGIFRADIVGKQRDVSGVEHNVVGNICHLATTQEVPLTIGIHFGMRYKVTGPVAGQRIVVTKIVRFPAILTPPSPGRPASQVLNVVELPVGATSYADYTLEQPWELVSGTWTFQFFERDRKLAELGFSVTEGASVSEAADPACFQLSS
jgi:hypothetical protein